MNEINKLSDQGYTTQQLGGADPSTMDGLTSDGAETVEESPSSAWMLFRELTETIVLSLIIFLLMRQVVQNYRIESHSMEPNFIEGQFILVNKLAYVLGEPQRGDVLVFHNPNNEQEDYIKRIIALPGDNLEIKDRGIYINEKAVDEPYIANRVPPGPAQGPYVIDPGHLFVMGDNRPNSSDSRAFGQLSQDLIVGKAWLRVWPIENWGLIQHYHNEPGQPLVLEQE
ncbi:MAG: signal peptidase I [Chloroflexota bacterium]